MLDGRQLLFRQRAHIVQRQVHLQHIDAWLTEKSQLPAGRMVRDDLPHLVFA